MRQLRPTVIFEAPRIRAPGWIASPGPLALRRRPITNRRSAIPNSPGTPRTTSSTHECHPLADHRSRARPRRTLIEGCNMGLDVPCQAREPRRRSMNELYLRTIAALADAAVFAADKPDETP